jgi:acetoin utilization deacetylase AcuC-like enzyme
MSAMPGLPVIASETHRLHNPLTAIVEGVPFETEDLVERAEIIRRALTGAGLGHVSEPTDHGLQPILAVHDHGLVTYLQEIWAESCAFQKAGSPLDSYAVVPHTFAMRGTRRISRQVEARPGYYCFGVATPILQHTWQAAYWSAQCALTGVDWLHQGARSAYALCRPPGHHAARDLYGGYCYLNNAAIAARALGGRVAILDIDYHHGNGTQEIFYAVEEVLYCSLHADPDQDYPYFWGAAEETGTGAGAGYNRNWPLPKGTGDEKYLEVLQEALEMVAAFGPQALIVSAGLDIGAGDPAGGFLISRSGFEKIGSAIAGLGLPTLIVQEGGYRLDALGESALALLSPFA